MSARPAVSSVGAEELPHRQRPDVRERVDQALAVPIPPGERQQLLGLGLGHAALNHSGGHAAHHLVGRHVARDHGAGADDRAGADRHAGRDRHAVADPDVVADRHPVRRAPVEEARLVLAHPVLRGAVDPVMLADAPGGMVAGVEPRCVGDGTELADIAPDGMAAAGEVGIVADRAVLEHRARADVGPGPERRAFDGGGLVDGGRLREALHFAPS